jgi:hypothetical protein
VARKISEPNRIRDLSARKDQPMDYRIFSKAANILTRITFLNGLAAVHNLNEPMAENKTCAVVFGARGHELLAPAVHHKNRST